MSAYKEALLLDIHGMIHREAVFTFGTASRLTNIAALAEAASIVVSLPDDHNLFAKLEMLNCESLVGYVLTKRGPSSDAYSGQQFINELTIMVNQLLADFYVKSCMSDKARDAAEATKTFGGHPVPDKEELRKAIEGFQARNKEKP